MSHLERKLLIDDLLNTIPNNIQMVLSNAISQLMSFMNDKIDFPHKCIPVKLIPNKLKDIFHRFANIIKDVTSNYGPYSYEELIKLDLVINPRRFTSWMTLLAIKINQFDMIFSATDFSK